MTERSEPESERNRGRDLALIVQRDAHVFQNANRMINLGDASAFNSNELGVYGGGHRLERSAQGRSAVRLAGLVYLFEEFERRCHGAKDAAKTCLRLVSATLQDGFCNFAGARPQRFRATISSELPIGIGPR